MLSSMASRRFVANKINASEFSLFPLLCSIQFGTRVNTRNGSSSPQRLYRTFMRSFFISFRASSARFLQLPRDSPSSSFFKDNILLHAIVKYKFLPSGSKNGSNVFRYVARISDLYCANRFMQSVPIDEKAATKAAISVIVCASINVTVKHQNNLLMPNYANHNGQQTGHKQGSLAEILQMLPVSIHFSTKVALKSSPGTPRPSSTTGRSRPSARGCA